MFKKLFVIIAAAGLSFSALGQNIEGVNARLDAMGGSGVGDDIGWTVGNPRLIVDYPDLIQGSAVIKNILGKGQTFGRIIAIKSIGEKICIGLTANNNKVLRSGFYKDAGDFMDASVDLEIGEINENFQTLPHLNFGIKLLDNLNLGAGFFLERTSFEKSITDTVNNIKDSVNEKSIYMPGGIIDAKIKFGNFSLVPQVKFGVPRVKGLDENAHLNNKHMYEFSSESGLYVKGGLMGWTEIGTTFLIAGFWYTKEAFQFNKVLNEWDAQNTQTTVSRDSLGYEFKVNIFDWFIGCQPSFSDNLYFGIEYDGGVEIGEQMASDTMIASDTVTGDFTRDTTSYYWYHDFRLGFEKPIGQVWIFDEFTPRAGLAYKIIKEKEVITSSVDKNFEMVEVKTTKTNLDELAAANEGLKVNAGIGVSKGRATVDISADLLRWNNSFISGPSAAMATLTIDISKRDRSAGSSTSASEPAPVSEPVFEEPFEEGDEELETPEIDTDF